MRTSLLLIVAVLAVLLLFPAFVLAQTEDPGDPTAGPDPCLHPPEVEDDSLSGPSILLEGVVSVQGPEIRFGVLKGQDNLPAVQVTTPED